MKVVIAPQAFKGSLSAAEAAQAMAEGVRQVFPRAELVLAPIADGGDGTLETLVEATRGRYRVTRATGPLGEPVTGRWGILGDGETAVIEMAQVAGLALVPAQHRDPRLTTTYGLGEVVRAALEAGHRRILLGIGGSATNDAGAGMLAALGVRFLDRQGRDLPAGGVHLKDLERVDTSGLLPAAREARFRVICDVTSPLLGPQGAAAVYAPQKGASPEAVSELDAALSRWAEVVRCDVGVDAAEQPGGGAAGGLGAGLLAFLGAELQPGIDLVCDLIRFDEQLTGADLVLTGEGQVDASTANNKGPVGVARRARARGVPTVCLTGALGPGYEAVYPAGIEAVVPIVQGPTTLKNAMSEARQLLVAATARAMRLIRVGQARGRP